MILKPCLVCGVPSNGPRCAQHKVPDRRPSRARRSAAGAAGPRLRRQTLARDRYTCRRCGVVDRSGRSLQADHIAPLDLGGANALDNMQTLCIDCHRAKSVAEQKEAAARRIEQRRESRRF